MTYHASVDDGFQSFFADANGVRLHWAETGLGELYPPLVLLHGLGDSHLTWRQVAPLLAKNRRVLMPDLPGHGYSERQNQSYRLDWSAKVMAAWLDSVRHGEVDLVGHSYGGGVAQMLLLERACIRRLVLESSGGLGREVGVSLRLASLPYVVEYLGQPFMARGTRMALKGPWSSHAASDVEEAVAMNRRRGTARSFARTVRDTIDVRGQRRFFGDRAHEVAELPLIAVLWGDRDPLIPISHGRAFATRVEGVTFETFHGAGHYLHQEQPEAFANCVRAFLEAPTQPRARLRPPAEKRRLRLAVPKWVRETLSGRGAPAR